MLKRPLEVMVSGANTEVRQAVTYVIEDALVNAGFNNVSNVDFERAEEETGSLLKQCAERHPSLFSQEVAITTNSFLDEEDEEEEETEEASEEEEIEVE